MDRLESSVATLESVTKMRARLQRVSPGFGRDRLEKVLEALTKGEVVMEQDFPDNISIASRRVPDSDNLQFQISLYGKPLIQIEVRTQKGKPPEYKVYDSPWKQVGTHFSLTSIYEDSVSTEQKVK